MSQANIGIDIGGTCIKGVILDGDELHYELTHDTQDDQENWQQSVATLFEGLKERSNSPIASVGLSAPGIADADNRSIAFMPVRLQGLEHFDWSALLREKVAVLNDAHAALWAESQWGVGRGVSNIVMLTLGTGVGGGLLLNGQLHQGFLQRAGHLGHVTVEAGSGVIDITGVAGSLEDAVGEATLAQRSLGRFTTTRDLVTAYQAGDTWATYVWLSALRKLALAIASFCNSISPELVVLAGGITQAGDHLLQPLEAFMEMYEWRPGGSATPIRLAKFRGYAGAIGAALYAKHHIFSSK